MNRRRSAASLELASEKVAESQFFLVQLRQADSNAFAVCLFSATASAAYSATASAAYGLGRLQRAQGGEARRQS